MALHLVLRIEGLACVCLGLWSHDWRLAAAGAGCWAVYPLIGKELRT